MKKFAIPMVIVLAGLCLAFNWPWSGSKKVPVKVDSSKSIIGKMLSSKEILEKSDSYCLYPSTKIDMPSTEIAEKCYVSEEHPDKSYVCKAPTSYIQMLKDNRGTCLDGSQPTLDPYHFFYGCHRGTPFQEGIEPVCGQGFVVTYKQWMYEPAEFVGTASMKYYYICDVTDIFAFPCKLPADNHNTIFMFPGEEGYTEGWLSGESGVCCWSE